MSRRRQLSLPTARERGGHAVRGKLDDGHAAAAGDRTGRRDDGRVDGHPERREQSDRAGDEPGRRRLER